jgi:hypothetical protein
MYVLCRLMKFEDANEDAIAMWILKNFMHNVYLFLLLYIV